MIAFLLGVSSLSSETISYLNKTDVEEEHPPTYVMNDISNLIKVVNNFQKLAKVKFNALYVDIKKNKIIVPNSEIRKENSQLVLLLAEQVIKANPLDANETEVRSKLLSMVLSSKIVPFGRTNNNRNRRCTAHSLPA